MIIIDLDFKIVTDGIYHYHTEDMVVIEMDLDEMIELYSKPIYFTSGWHKFNDVEILNKGIVIFNKIANYVNAIANKNHFTYPLLLCGSEKTLNKFYIMFNCGTNWCGFDISKTYNRMNIKIIKTKGKLYLCNNENHIKNINENCYGYYYRQ
jgi:hypothetical protein